MLNILSYLLFLISDLNKRSSVMLSFVFFLFYLGKCEKSEMSINHWGEIDMLSWWLVGLTLWLVSLCYLALDKGFVSYGFSLCLFFLEILVILSFFVKDFFYFYFMFESSLVPITILILGWGAQSEKLEAGYYMFLYTMFGSLPLLGYIFFGMKLSGSGFMGFFGCNNQTFWFFMIIAFLIKFPLYLFHVWLLKAHLEAPTEGSMLLAGVLLKLGGYGLMRILKTNYNFIFDFLNFLVFFSLLGSLMMAVNCLSESNVKLLIAKSSVVHMGPCVAGVMSMNELSFSGVLGLMVGHGLCSSGLFYLVGKMYEMSGSRSLMLNKSGLNYAPLFSFILFMLLIVNSSAPPSLNLMSEIMLFMGLGNFSYFNVFLLGLISFFSLGYNIYLYSMSQQGSASYLSKNMKNMNVLMVLTSVCHWAPVNVMILLMFGMK